MVAFVCDLAPGEFIHTIGDAHIYLDAVDQVKEQISREPLPLPTLEIVDRGQTSIDDFLLSDFKLQNYESMPAIKARWRCETRHCLNNGIVKYCKPLAYCRKPC